MQNAVSVVRVCGLRKCCAGMPATCVAAPSVAHVVCGCFTLRTATFVSHLPHVQMLVQLLVFSSAGGLRTQGHAA